MKTYNVTFLSNSVYCSMLIDAADEEAIKAYFDTLPHWKMFRAARPATSDDYKPGKSHIAI